MWVYDKGISSFKIYQEMFPVITNALNALVVCEEKNKNSSFAFLILDSKIKATDILSFIASGYNNYDTKLKVMEYNKARNAISILQSNLILLNNYKILLDEDLNENYTNLEDKLKMISGVLRKIEKLKN